MPLLQEDQQPQDKAGLTPESEENLNPEESDAGSDKRIHLDAQMVEDEQMKLVQDENERAALKEVIDNGTELMLGEQSEFRLFDEIRPEEEVPIEDQLGAAGFGFMLMLQKSSGNSIDGKILGLAAPVLLARAAEFMNETGIADISDQEYAEAYKMIVVKFRELE